MKGRRKRLDRFIEAPTIQPIFARHFVIARIDVQERGDKAVLNTPGGEALEAQFGSTGAGLPFFAFLGERGELIANSNRPVPGKSNGENVGHPYGARRGRLFHRGCSARPCPRSLPQTHKRSKNYLHNQKR